LCEHEYKSFLKSKESLDYYSGFEINDSEINDILHPFQKAIVKWAILSGRSAIFADCGLGKTFMQIEFARIVGGTSLIFAPLFVTKQTISEGIKLGVNINFCNDSSDIKNGYINITNYEKVHKFLNANINSIILDESSILKSIDGKTRNILIKSFKRVRYRLACTATPAPNDIAEIGNHSDFLGIKTREEMLATYFVHDNDGWRLKGHAHKNFWEWLTSWSIFVKHPRDIGFDCDGYDLPPLSVDTVLTETNYKPEGILFPELLTDIGGITGRIKARRESITYRSEITAEIVNKTTEQFVIWTGLNDESKALSKILDDCVTIEGKDNDDVKTRNFKDFLSGRVKTLITKPKIAGFGINMQQINKTVFFGLSDSYEAYYQCIRRFWRYGQNNPVSALIVVSKPEKCIVDNVMRKQEESELMRIKMMENVISLEKRIIGENAKAKKFVYETDKKEGSDWTAYLGDSVEIVNREIPNDYVDLSVFSPPFISLYTYTDTIRDMGNSLSEDDFFKHFEFLIKDILRVTKPGRLCCCHVSQVPAMKVRDGYIGLKDFRGKTINSFIKHGWIYHSDICIDKDPQAQAIRTKAKGLLFVQMRKDSSWSRQALSDFIVVFRKPGDNQVKIIPDITNNMWIEWARPVWYNIKETNVLNTKIAKSEKDERHICPLQLETIERCIRLWSNKNEIVLSPFMGIGSEGYKSLDLGRRFIGIELKPEYFNVACKNLKKAENEKSTQLTLNFNKGRK
jgi:DNA modification methylase